MTPPRSPFSRPARRATPIVAAALCLTTLVSCAQLSPPVADPAAEASSRPEVTDLDLTQITKDLRLGRYTSEELVTAYLDRIERFDGKKPFDGGMGTIVSLNEDAADQARQLDEEREAGKIRGPLHGIPVLVKDNINTAKLPTSHGNQALASYQPHEDAEVVKRLQDAGAIVLGKTNMAEFAMFWDTVSSVRGRTLNPFDAGRNINGSSGGSAAAVAASFAPIAIGTESCGSITDPAAFTSLVGFRPTVGAVSMTGTDYNPLGDSIGPLALSVTDAATLLDTMIGPDSTAPWTITDAQAQQLRLSDYLTTDGLQGARIGYLVHPFGGWDWEASPETDRVIDTVEENLAVFEEQGATVVRIELTPEWIAESIRAGDDYWAVDGHEDYFVRTAADWPEGLAERTEPKDKINFGDLFAASPDMEETAIDWLSGDDNTPRDPQSFASAQGARAQFARGVDALFAEYDLDALSFPTVAARPTPVHADPAELIDPDQTGTHCGWANFSDRPVVSVPAGFEGGLPVGISLLGSRFDDGRLIGFAYSFEQATGHHRLPEMTSEE